MVAELKQSEYPGRWWMILPDGRIECRLCPRFCKLNDGQRGFCFVRQRVGDRMMLTTYGRSSGFCVDPIEKKPLNRLREQIEQSLAAGENAVLACSALKRKYRDCLRVNSDVKFVFLRGEYALIADHLRHRRGHFMDRGLLQSQFADLEEPQPDEAAITIELGRTPEETVEEIKTKLHLASKD